MIPCILLFSVSFRNNAGGITHLFYGQLVKTHSLKTAVGEYEKIHFINCKALLSHEQLLLNIQLRILQA